VGLDFVNYSPMYHFDRLYNFKFSVISSPFFHRSFLCPTNEDRCMYLLTFDVTLG